MKSRKNNLGKRFDKFHGHPSIQGQKDIKEKNNLCQGLIHVSHGHPSIHPGTKEIKEKNNLCQGLIQVSHWHPSIQGQRKSKKKTIYAKV
jgi:hypothetical protein